MAKRVVFDGQSAERIARVVRQVEAGDRDAPGLRQYPRLQGSPSAAKGIRFCTWSASWQYNAVASVEFPSGQTATARNLILGVDEGDGWVARKGSAGWTLVSFDMTKQPGYSAGEIQLFGHSSSDAIAQWYSITTCATATA